MATAKENDAYAVLGVPRDAAADQIRREWRKRQARYRSEPARLRQIDAAAAVLLNPARRAALDASLREAAPHSAAGTHASDPDSLDFTDAAPSEPPLTQTRTPARKSAAPRKAKASSDRDKAGSPRRLGVPVMIVIAIALIVVFAMTRRSSEEAVTASPSTKPPAPIYQSPPADKPRQPATPAPKLDTSPPQAPASQSRPAPAIPRQFLQAFEEYAKRPASKAVALALDHDGRYAYGVIAGHATQPEANQEALSECMRLKAQSGIQENCRLYASGDKVIW